MTDTVLFHIDAQQVAWLTLNKPEVHNAFDDQIIAQLLAHLRDIEGNTSVRALVLNSNGKNFSAGADLGWMRSMAAKNREQNVADAGELGQLMYELDNLRVPTIALVQGAAFGGAVGLAACCDMVLANPGSSFCLSEVKIGLIPAVICPYVIRNMGARAARRYVLTAERFFAADAMRHGLVTEVTDDPLTEAVKPLLQAIVNNGPAAVAAAKRLLLDIHQRPINEDVVRTTVERIADIRVSDEGQEGLSAFLEKRKAGWLTN
ncbi:gamma-carboxygeranoyl-CoA hydratase [Aliidiomarina sedimenti]|uniref:Gamma-carboxygeranoyl-CoA hydratase n=1 Tax=Aliidiomarina sedimenti TaxID=1933879 RepID=A0ABY0C2J4_9GAMM|nr:enoyl-CoA hydratase-related protein [Aliidiomarina sedimenti]RUO32076.1 gamma-carboxygeranoyl-CoA hydratase [Aliidiomarina sedimenti]